MTKGKRTATEAEKVRRPKAMVRLKDLDVRKRAARIKGGWDLKPNKKL